jgi:hypothetical protein
MNKKLLALLVAVVALSAVACKKDNQINSVIKDLDVFTNELVAKVEKSSNAPSGVDDAQKFLDSKKAELKSKLDSIKNVRGYQVSEETKKTMTDSLTKNVTSVAQLQIKYVQLSIRDAAFKAKLEKLVNDYTQLLRS